MPLWDTLQPQPGDALLDASCPLNTEAAQRALAEMRRLGVDFVQYDRIAA